ncbi:MAG: FAD-dependent oxidoreductase, partial [Patescibacteria group bacterium]
VENFPGYEHILGSELIEKMRKQAENFGTEIRNENILSIDLSKRPFELTTLDKTYLGKSVIIATGAKALWLNLDSEQRLRGKGVSACATCDGFFFRNKTVAVIGGGDTAMEEALVLTKFASKVYVLHRRDSFRASKIMQDRVLNHEKIEVKWNTSVTEVLGENKVSGIKVNTDGKESEIALDGLFLAIGHKPDTDLFKDVIELDPRGYVINTQRAGLEGLRNREKIQENSDKSDIDITNAIKKTYDPYYHTMTSIPGIFAAGDCVDFHYRQAATAAGMGVAAALDAERWLEAQLG